VILIAHRLSSVQKCNIILVMKDGVIIERGTHAQVRVSVRISVSVRVRVRVTVWELLYLQVTLFLL
jgi:ABC-type protease/lipase transport system fused ATPase/permease subunit